MNKYVGQSEENIRNLFSEAINDTDQSSLHVIIFDEIDAICKTRGRGASGSSNVNDSIVNQLLTMIDGYNSLNNIFVIGMTNRKDLLDDALIRAGRLEVHVEIGLPDKEGREQIFRIHTNNMKTNNMLGDDVVISELAVITENYSGAEIEGVVKNAGGRALHEDLINTKEKQEENDRAIVVLKKHFIDAVGEVIPAFGSIVKQTMNLIPENYKHKSEKHVICYNQVFDYINNDDNKNKRLHTILINGENMSGKTVLAIKIALDSKITNTKIIRAIDTVSFDEIGKVLYISDIVKNSYVSENSLIVIDDIEIAINYAQLGNHLTFSNRLYQMLITLLKTEPTTKDHRITFICTCTDKSFSQSMEKFFDLTFDL